MNPVLLIHCKFQGFYPGVLPLKSLQFIPLFNSFYYLPSAVGMSGHYHSNSTRATDWVQINASF